MRVAWLSYLPLPGLGAVAARQAPDDRFTRYHARQGGWLVSLWWLGILLFGSLAALPFGDGFRLAVGIPLLAWTAGGLGAMGYGTAQAVRGRFVRIRPVWDLLVYLQR